MAFFPTDLISDILSLLPVKTLVRFKCVSKPWGSLIDAPDFSKIHLHHSFKTNTNLKLLLNRGSWNASVDFDRMDNMEELPRLFNTEGSEWGVRIFGSCNGLFAVYHEESIALWNPSTRSCHYLPKLRLKHAERGDYNILGFGYDEIANDYRVVVILTKHGSGIVMTYSLKADSWRKIKDCPYEIPNMRQDGAYVNGSLHWASKSLFFGLDLGVEEYHQVPDNKTEVFDYFYVGVLGGSLCVTRDYGETLEVWVMKEYGVRESWTAIVPDLGLRWEYPPSCMPYPYDRASAYSRSGDKILLDNGEATFKLAWWNLTTQTREEILIPGAPIFYKGRTYMESLVSVMPINSRTV